MSRSEGSATSAVVASLRVGVWTDWIKGEFWIDFTRRASRMLSKEE